MSFGEKILQYKDEILADLDTLMRIPSVSSSDKNAAASALGFVLDRAAEMGFKTANIGGIAGHVEFGEGDGLAAVLAHVDVVPAGEGWSTEPYCLTERDGRLYGRGIVDDKGPAIIALYCLKALKDSGIEPERRLRLILGAAEEIGMEDMELYFKEYEMPDMAFTPDSEYGICTNEKGILQLEVYSSDNDSPIIGRLCAGSAVNAVPSAAEALIDCTEPEDSRVRGAADKSPCGCDFIRTMDGLRMTVSGRAAHACVPQEGTNAAMHLIRILSECFGRLSAGSLCSFLDDAVGLEIDGASLGIACSDEQSGALTVNVGVIDIDESGSRALIDIRYPVSASVDEIFEAVSERASYEGLMTRVLNHVAPLSADENAPIVMILREAYREITGEEPKLYSTGGGTYARTLRNNGVAFGPVFEGDPARIHDVDESMDKNNFFRHAQICLEAMYRMAVG